MSYISSTIYRFMDDNSFIILVKITRSQITLPCKIENKSPEGSIVRSEHTLLKYIPSNTLEVHSQQHKSIDCL